MSLTEISNDEFINAAGDDDVDLIKKFIAQGGNINVTDASGFTALHQAVKSGHLFTVNFLLKNGANPNICDDDVRSPLFFAAALGKEEILDCLLAHHADPFILPNGRFSAKKNNFHRIAERLPQIKAQSWLIERIQCLYPYARPDGICLAIAYLGLKAFLADDIETFMRRLALIGDIPVNQFVKIIREANERHLERIKKARFETLQEMERLESVELLRDWYEAEFEIIENNKKKILSIEEAKRLFILKKKFYNLFQKNMDDELKKLTEKERLLHEVAIFCGEIKIFQQKELYDFLDLSSNDIVAANEIFKLLMPLALEAKGGIANIDNFSNAYTEDDLNTYLDTLRSVIRDAKSKHPIALMLASADHAITVCYHPRRDKWLLINANQRPIVKSIPQKELAAKIPLAFFSKNKVAVFSTSIYVAEENRVKAKAYIKDWQKSSKWKAMHKVTSGKVNMKDSSDYTWHDVVHYDNHLSRVKKVEALSFFKVNKKLLVGFFLLGIAITLTLSGIMFATGGIAAVAMVLPAVAFFPIVTLLASLVIKTVESKLKLVASSEIKKSLEEENSASEFSRTNDRDIFDDEKEVDILSCDGPDLFGTHALMHEKMPKTNKDERLQFEMSDVEEEGEAITSKSDEASDKDLLDPSGLEELSNQPEATNDTTYPSNLSFSYTS